ncbi:MAG: hypothetical protein L0387_41590 [Acidobacteria bacterium]|nr:hypothetical protein [Acidobacteriota bacterium]MCI0720993.1 hypothetical protein [Acidobacteriota bacterium]
MISFRDRQHRQVRLTDERLAHLETDHPEMKGQASRIGETLADPDQVIRSATDSAVELFYKLYPSTPVTTKFLCIVVKVLPNDNFIITSYYTDTVKKGEALWEKK